MLLMPLETTRGFTMVQRVRRTALVLIVMLGLTACSQPVGDVGGGGTAAPAGAEQTGDTAAPADADEADGELTIAIAEEPDDLDPTLARTLVGRMVFVNMCEKLYDVDADLELIPQLAADLPEVSEDGLTVTIPLRSDVTFNDGTPFNAEAVAQSLERHMTLEGSSRASELSQVESVTVVDDATVELTLSEPFTALTSILADRSGMIMSPQALDELGEDFGENPVCVGPFQFVERQAQDRIVLERADDYYDADQVQLDRIIFRIIADANVRTANLRSGDVDMAERIATTDVDQIESDANLQLFTATSIGYQGMTINIGNANGIAEAPQQLDTPLASDPRVREAFELAIDREALNEVVFDGRFTPGCSPISPNSPYADPDLECPAQDLDRARQLLADAGAEGLAVELVHANDPVNQRQAEVVQQMATEAGFEVSLAPTEFATALDETDAGNYEMFQIGWSGRVDPDGNIHAFHHTDGSLNISKASDPEVDDLLAQTRAEADVETRRGLFNQLVDTLRERRNIIYLYHQNLFVGARASITGFEFYGDGLPRFKTAAIGE
jgi:peptide/nickel transport system substrate-binding protein